MAEITDTERLDFLMESGMFILSNEGARDGYWLSFVDDEGDLSVQVENHKTPREAIDAAIREQKERGS